MIKQEVSSRLPYHLYLSPHFDDAILSCGGLMYSQRQQGEAVTVLTLFAQGPGNSSLSAFARHLHAQWGLGNRDVTHCRQEEDMRACKILGVSFEHGNFIEAPYRLTPQGRPLYCAYDVLAGRPLDEDEALIAAMISFLDQRIKRIRADDFTPFIYLPIDSFGHVDHALVCQAVSRLSGTDMHVRYYDPWPGVEKYSLRQDVHSWKSLVYPIDLTVKTQAVLCYESQIGLWGGTEKKARQRLQQYAVYIGKGVAAERIWEGDTASTCYDRGVSQPASPLVVSHRRWRLGDFKVFLRCLRWNDLRDFLPVGNGICLDVGCGTGPHRAAATEAGYTWFGLDYPQTPFHLSGDAHMLPVGSERIACVIFWTVTSLLNDPSRAFKEIYRVLEPGGVLCGSSSFLEPVHGHSTYGLSYVVLERILKAEGFSDIVLIPDISGFALILWTFLRRYGGKAISNLALPLTRLWLLPLAFIGYFMSFLWFRLGRGTGFSMEWITTVMPLEFAGHVIFVARKK